MWCFPVRRTALSCGFRSVRVRLAAIGAVLCEQNDEWQASSRDVMVEAFARIDKQEIDFIRGIATKAA